MSPGLLAPWTFPGRRGDAEPHRHHALPAAAATTKRRWEAAQALRVPSEGRPCRQPRCSSSQLAAGGPGGAGSTAPCWGRGCGTSSPRDKPGGHTAQEPEGARQHHIPGTGWDFSSPTRQLNNGRKRKPSPAWRRGVGEGRTGRLGSAEAKYRQRGPSDSTGPTANVLGKPTAEKKKLFHTPSLK